MAKILNDLTITSPVSKLVELPNNYVINGQFYNKTDISPIPLTFGVYGSSTQCEMATYKSCVPVGIIPNRVNTGVVPDSTDSSVSYTVKSAAYMYNDNIAYHHIYKTSKDSLNNISILEYKGKADAANKRSCIDIVDQDDTYLYVKMMSDSYKALIYRINKETMTASGTYDLGADRYVTFIKATDMYIYFSVTGANNYFAVIKYNKVAGTGTIIKDDTGASGAYTTQCHVAVDPMNDNIFYAVRDGFMLDKLHRVVIKRYIIDVNTDVVDVSYMNLDLTGLTWGASIPNATNHIGVLNELMIVRDNGQSYLTYVRYGNNAVAKDSSLFVFEFNGQDDLRLVQETNFTPIVFNMLLTTNNNKTLVLGNAGQLRFLTWNQYSKTFEHTSSVVKPILSLGCDIDGNVLIQYQDTSVEVYSAVMAIDVKSVLENEEYEYEGVPIATNAIVYVQNYSSEFISANVELTLIGPAVFSATGENKMSLTTSSIGASVIPVTINGPGYVRVAIQLV